LAISEAIVSQICEHVGMTRVNRVALEIGRLLAVAPDAVRFCFDVAAQGTPVEGAALEIIEIPAQGVCRQCGGDAVIEDSLVAIGACQACGSLDLDFVRGRELRIKSVEVS